RGLDAWKGPRERAGRGAVESPRRCDPQIRRRRAGDPREQLATVELDRGEACGRHLPRLPREEYLRRPCRDVAPVEEADGVLGGPARRVADGLRADLEGDEPGPASLAEEPLEQIVGDDGIARRDGTLEKRRAPGAGGLAQDGGGRGGVEPPEPGAPGRGAESGAPDGPPLPGHPAARGQA